MGSMRSDVNHRRSGRRNGRSWHDGMAKHVDAVMKRAKDRPIALTNTSELRTALTNTKRVPQRLTQPISPHKRLKERAGLWMFAKQSEIITEPNMITSSMRRRVREDVRAVMAEDSRDRRQMWNKAGQGVENNINRNVVFRMPLSADNVFSIRPCFRKKNLKSPVNETTVFNTKGDSTLSSYDLPTTAKIGDRYKKKQDSFINCCNPLLLDYAERILSALPQLFLRNDDSTSYSVAATSIVACSLRRHGVCPKGSNFQQKELELSQGENDMHEKFWRSFFENMSPLNTFSVDSAFLTEMNMSSAKLFEFEDIPTSNEHVLSNSDDANTISDAYLSPKISSSNNILDCSFNDYFPKIGKNDVASLKILSVNSNDLMKLAIDDDFPTNIPWNLPSAQPEFDLNEYHPITVNAWFERDSANMSDASKAIYHNAKNGKSWPSYRPMEYSFTEPVISESMNVNQWMKNSSIRKKIRTEVPDFRFKLNHEACNAFNSVCGSQASQFSFDF
ncbi:unnamed protein product [Wuchereria bancrofti]|uniref:Uncharacterized protein n=1 Tax=Wuchereria bancrofti TaxID=6293 RepID=A0A3P7ETP1_WUCBA|nr:unnamed protein product [Wuchereria bancrofti]